ncbi:hypothetical protein PF005_g16639 [Phytophthora fragariae]|uniref:Uncharacterized protein n=1 Tax=Phytophthora fragariae TaxID=53985 RepID=A0A6A3X865_9STRA|nr:hypothetical protein PF005_g16639 [Phytophthora fragariae]
MAAVRFVRADREEELEGSDMRKSGGVETGEGASRVAVSAAVCSQNAGNEERRPTGEGARAVEVAAAARPVKAVELLKMTESTDSAEHHDTEEPGDEIAAFVTSPWRVRATEKATARTAVEAAETSGAMSVLASGGHAHDGTGSSGEAGGSGRSDAKDDGNGGFGEGDVGDSNHTGDQTGVGDDARDGGDDDGTGIDVADGDVGRARDGADSAGGHAGGGVGDDGSGGRA